MVASDPCGASPSTATGLDLGGASPGCTCSLGRGDSGESCGLLWTGSQPSIQTLGEHQLDLFGPSLGEPVVQLLNHSLFVGMIVLAFRERDNDAWEYWCQQSDRTVRSFSYMKLEWHLFLGVAVVVKPRQAAESKQEAGTQSCRCLFGSVQPVVALDFVFCEWEAWTKTFRRFTLDGWEWQDGEEVRPNPAPRCRLERTINRPSPSTN